MARCTWCGSEMGTAGCVNLQCRSLTTDGVQASQDFRTYPIEQTYGAHSPEQLASIIEHKSSRISNLEAEVERLRESLGEALQTLHLAWNCWNRLGYNNNAIAEKVAAALQAREDTS